MRGLIGIMACLLLAASCQAQIITVDDDGIADFNNIQAAIDSASDNDTIIVQPGLYEESINFLGKNITVTGTNPANPNVVAATTIDGGVVFSGTEDPNCILAGFNINSVIYGSYENHTHATISYCVLQANEVPYGNVIAFCDGTIKNCLIADNVPDDSPLPIIDPAIYHCDGLIKNCTIVNNYCASAIEVRWNGGQTTIENCIVYANYADSQIFAPPDATVNILYTDIQGGLSGIFGGGTVNWGPGNIDTDPSFVREGYWDFNEPATFFEGDYHLQSSAGRWDPNTNGWVLDPKTSPCIDAGNPGCLTGSEPTPHGNRIDMGAYGGTPTASKSPANWRNLADLTNDWVVDLNDLAVFLDYWLDNGQCVPADLNRNRSVNFTDFTIFADNWLWEQY